jgi:hypothetical protein
LLDAIGRTERDHSLRSCTCGAMKSIISSYDLVAFIVSLSRTWLAESHPQLFKHSAKRDSQAVPRPGLPLRSASVAPQAQTGDQTRTAHPFAHPQAYFWCLN